MGYDHNVASASIVLHARVFSDGRAVVVMLLLVVAGVLFFTSNAATSYTDCWAKGTFCLQVNTDSTYSFQVPDESSAEAAMSIVIKRSWRQGRFYAHEWSVEISKDMQEMRANISFIPVGAERGKFMLVFTGGVKYLVNDMSKEWREDNWRDISSAAFWDFFPNTAPELLPHSLRFNSSDRLNEFLGFESKKMLVRVSMKYWTQKGQKYKYIFVTTGDALRLFEAKNIATTPPKSGSMTPEHVKPGRQEIQRTTVLSHRSRECLILNTRSRTRKMQPIRSSSRVS